MQVSICHIGHSRGNHQRVSNSIEIDSSEFVEHLYRSQKLMNNIIEFQAYESNNANGPLLLAEIPIRRAGGPLTSSRKIGAELSRRIHSFYTNSFPDCVL